MTEVFVFGSNLAGRHGKGSALEARKHHGAIYGQGEGRQGNSYGIPTKDGRLGRSLSDWRSTLSLPVIHSHVETFLAYAKEHPEDTFRVAAIGCSNAGYKPKQIGPFFAEAGPNVILPPEFEEFRTRRYRELAPEAGSSPQAHGQSRSSKQSDHP
jgi:hypothetical protein